MMLYCGMCMFVVRIFEFMVNVDLFRIRFGTAPQNGKAYITQCHAVVPFTAL